jgi:calcineurin-like phosphoesterase family protein
MHPVPLPTARPLLLDETGLRVTVMRGQEVFAEYDLLQKRWIRGGELHDTGSWKKTLSDYRRHSGFELANPVRQAPEGVWLIADLHLGHANIIRYCSRPFVVSSVDEMDRVLIQNWNATVPPAGRAYLLGDLRYGRDARPSARYRRQLNGDITIIRGNHDTGDLDAIPSTTIVSENRTFLLIHDPADAPGTFDGWVIHGHHHNNDLRHYPFMDFQNHRINVSAEVVGYSPVGIRELSRNIEEHEKSGDTAPLLLRYRYTF